MNKLSVTSFTNLGYILHSRNFATEPLDFAGKTVVVTGANDAASDGIITYSIVLATPTGTDSSGYTSSNPSDVTGQNWDDERLHLFRTTNGIQMLTPARVL